MSSLTNILIPDWIVWIWLSPNAYSVPHGYSCHSSMFCYQAVFLLPFLMWQDWPEEPQKTYSGPFFSPHSQPLFTLFLPRVPWNFCHFSLLVASSELLLASLGRLQPKKEKEENQLKPWHFLNLLIRFSVPFSTRSLLICFLAPSTRTADSDYIALI